MKIRRVVTGFDSADRATINSDVLVDDMVVPGGMAVAPLWGYGERVTLSAPSRLESGDEGFEIDRMRLNWGVSELPPGKTLPMHSTRTVDLITVLEGEVTCVLDSGETILLKAHEVMLQRGVAHAWENRGQVRCVWTYATLGCLDA